MSKTATFLLVLLLTALTAQAQDAWVKQYTASTALNSVWMIDARTAVAVGDGGYITRTADGGATWTTMSSPSTERLNRVRFFTAQLGFACGVNGTLLKSNDGGVKWTAVNTDTTLTVFDCWFYSEQEGMIAGQAGFIRATTNGGTSWTNRSSTFTGNNVFQFSFVTDSIGWITGNKGNIARTSDKGRTWRSQNGVYNGSMYSVSFATKRNGSIVGQAGQVQHTNNAGATWISQPTDVPLTLLMLYSVQHIDSTLAYTSGSGGIFGRTTNGGAMWNIVSFPSAASLQGMHFLNAQTGMVVCDDGTIWRTESGGVLGVDDAPKARAHRMLDVYPNPARSGADVTITATDPDHKALTIDVCDAVGRLVSRVRSTSADLTHTLRTAGLLRGTYFVHATSQRTSRTVTLVIE